jgi:hypothetical protein
MYCLKIGDSGVQETATATSQFFAIPNNNGGFRAQLVRITVVTASETVYVRPVQANGTVTAENGLPVAKENPVILDVKGFTHIAALRADATNVVFNITPIEA